MHPCQMPKLTHSEVKRDYKYEEYEAPDTTAHDDQHAGDG
jgi:hypothetical protein